MNRGSASEAADGAALDGPSPDGESLADRYCAWAGRAGSRLVFCVRGLDLLARPWEGLGPGVLLGVRREAGGRRVVWSAVVSGPGPGPSLRRAVAALRQDGRGELHHHPVAGGPAACARVAADLGRPPLEEVEAFPLAC